MEDPQLLHGIEMKWTRMRFKELREKRGDEYRSGLAVCEEAVWLELR
jgi:hypothetical protein